MMMNRRYFNLLAGVFLVLVVTGNPVQGMYQKGYGWPMFGQDFSHSRYNPRFSNVPLGEIKFLGEYETGGKIVSSPALGDLDGDSELEIVFGSEDHYVYALRGRGGELWKYKTNGPIISSPAIVDLEGSGMKVVVGSEDGNLYVLNSDGTLFWKYETSGRITSSPAVVDFEGDGKKEIIFGSWDKNLYVLNSKGEKIVSFETLGIIESSPAVGDINADGRLDIIFGSNDNRIYIISPPGKGHALEKIGVYPTSGGVISSPSLADLDGNGFLEILVGSSDGTFHCLFFQETGREEETKFKNGEWITEWEIIKTKIAKKWDYGTSGEIISSPGIADVDGDGRLEVVVGSKDKNLYLFDSEGKKLLKYTVDSKIISSPSLADLNGDGKLEIVIASFDGRIYILNSKGFRVWEYLIPGKISSSPTIADLDGDGKLEIVVSSWNKRLYVFGQKKEAIEYRETSQGVTKVTTTLPSNTERQIEKKESQVKNKETSKSNNLGSIGSLLLNPGIASGIPLALVISLGLILCYFSYKKGTSEGILEVRRGDKELIDMVLEERGKTTL